MGKVQLPTDGKGDKVPLTPAVVALERTVNGSISTSQSLGLEDDTTFIEVYAIDQDVYLKWGTTTVSASNFDEVIPANQVRQFMVPEGQTAIRYIERASSATVIIIQK